MSHFVDTLQDVLLENNMTFKDLSRHLPIPTRTIYDLKKFNPTIQNALLIVDYFSSSLDYFEKRIDIFQCDFNKNYNINFYENLIKELKIQNISQAKLCREIHISQSCFKRWEKGVLPTYENLILITNYLVCSIDQILGRNYIAKK